MAHKLLARLIVGMQNKEEVEVVVAPVATPAKRPRHKRTQQFSKRNSYATYLYRVLKSVHPDIGISKKSMQIMDAFVVDMFERIMESAATLARYNSRHTLTTREIQHAVRLVLPGSLASHAIQQGQQSYLKFTTHE